jgi:pimeloyl-ACP methyl ester carboxylesterase
MLGSSRLLAVDLLGFGQSPKPGNCMYTLKDHVEAIETSLLELDDDEPQQKQNSRRLMTMMSSSSSSFHLVAHSMGCIIALALAAKHPTRVKSITLLAPVSS